MVTVQSENKKPLPNMLTDVIDADGQVVFRGWYVGGRDLYGQGRHGSFHYIFRLDQFQPTIEDEIQWEDEMYKQPGGVYREFQISLYHENKHGVTPRTSEWVYRTVN